MQNTKPIGYSDNFFPLIVLLLLLTGLFGCGVLDDDDEETASGPSNSSIFLWISATSINGNIGGINGANTICETDAAGVNLPSGFAYTHRAVLGTPTNNPRNFITDSRPIRRASDNVQIIDTWANYMNGSVTVSVALSSSSISYRTGLSSSGSVTTSHCNNWTNGSSTLANIGYATSTTANRLGAVGANCSFSYRLLCVSY